VANFEAISARNRLSISYFGFKVIGAGYVSIYDGTRWSEERDTIYQLPPGVEQFYLLASNFEYDMRIRKVILL
jgi:hypothetical protein